MLDESVGKEIKLTVYNSKTDQDRVTTIIPSDNWGGNGKIGANIRHISTRGVHENVWHVMDVYPKSPAERAELQDYVDYIVGTPDLLFDSSEDFFSLVKSNEKRNLMLYVYNIKHDAVRQVTLIPDRNWGGEGSIGCDVGYGYIHRIPITEEQKKNNIEAGAKAAAARINREPNTPIQQNTVVSIPQVPIPNANKEPFPSANLIEQYNASLSQHLKKEQGTQTSTAKEISNNNTSSIAEILTYNKTDVPPNPTEVNTHPYQLPRPVGLTQTTEISTESHFTIPQPQLQNNPLPEVKTAITIPTTSPITPARFSSITSPSFEIPQATLTPQNNFTIPTSVTTPITDQFPNLQQLQQKQQELKEKLDALKAKQPQKI